MKNSTLSLPDTNTIVRYLIKDDIHQFTTADAFFTKVLNGTQKALILESVLAECIYVLTKIYKVPRKEAAVSLTDLLLYKGVQNPDQEELSAGLNLFAETKLDIVDCILCAKARKNAATLFTFDADLKKYQEKQGKDS